MISFSEEKRIFTIHTEHTTYQMMADEHDVLLHLYYGRRSEGEMDYLIRRRDRGFSGNLYDAAADRSYSLDVLPQEFPVSGTGDYRRCAMRIELANGSVSCDLRYAGYEIRRGKYSLPGLPAVYGDASAETLAITLKDKWGSGVTAELLYGVLPEIDVITRSVIVRNEGAEPFAITRLLSANVDFQSGTYDVLTFYGRHGMERRLQRERVCHGVRAIGSGRGMSSHQYNPLMILASPETTEDAGTCWAMEYVYSGGFLAEAECDPFSQVRMHMGLMVENFRWPLAPGEEFAAPEVIMSCSTEGLSVLSHHLHDCIRGHICRGKWKDAVRPILLNSWEGCYFDFDGERILGLAKRAKELGFDMLVMDDGWFGKRDTDTSGLGDWYVNEKKLGMKLSELTAGVHELGLKFGIWFEPEAISEDSDLYRAHPDYAFAIPGRKPVLARDQLILDFSREEVREAVYSQMTAILDEAEIDYIKWDYNRCISDVYSSGAAEQGTVLHRYMLGLYDFLEKLLSRYPDLLIEGCSGGGGRFDAGMLYYTPQIWCSDNTDAIDRLLIQHGTSFGYPCSAVGAHVSPCPNHQNGRMTPLSTRGVVAMAGTFGYELDPGRMTEEEREEVKAQVTTFRRFAPLVAEGLYYRLTDPACDPDAAWLHVSRDGSEALLAAVSLEIRFNPPQRYVRLKGLESAAMYRVEDVSGVEETLTASGAALMECGLPLPVYMEEYRAVQFHLIRI